MGTRADFYIGNDEKAEWLGSIAYDGYRMPDEITKAKTEEEFRAAVTQELLSRDDATVPYQGWPWPWDCSDTTDYHYWFFDGNVHVGKFKDIPEGVTAFPDMSAKKNVTLGARSGLLILRG